MSMFIYILNISAENSVIKLETTFLSPHYAHKATSNPTQGEHSAMWNHLSVGILLYKSYEQRKNFRKKEKKKDKKCYT
jgi:hypothetical protein